MRKFKKIYLEITNVCNLACEFCPKTGRLGQFMSKEVFQEILYKIKGYSDQLYFHVMGEPLLHPDLGLFFEMCDTAGFRVNITTNGTMLDEVGELMLSKPALRHVNISLHSFQANHNNSSVDHYLKKIFLFVEQARVTGRITICLRLWNLSEQGMNCSNQYILHSIEQAFGLDYKIEDKLTPFEGIKLSQRIFLNQAERFAWPGLEEEEIHGRAFCHGLRNQIAILVDGTVVPCCLDGEGVIQLGNIREASMGEILQGERARAMYEGFSKREAVEDLCKRCGYRQRFS